MKRYFLLIIPLILAFFYVYINSKKNDFKATLNTLLIDSNGSNIKVTLKLNTFNPLFFNVSLNDVKLSLYNKVGVLALSTERSKIVISKGNGTTLIPIEKAGIEIFGGVNNDFKDWIVNIDVKTWLFGNINYNFKID